MGIKRTRYEVIELETTVQVAGVLDNADPVAEQIAIISQAIIQFSLIEGALEAVEGATLLRTADYDSVYNGQAVVTIAFRKEIA